MQVQSSVLEEKVRRLQEKAKIAEEAIESKSQMQWHMVELEEMGFGFKQLKQFHNIIEEITQANDLSEADRSAVDIFLDHVRRHYDDILGFEKRLDELKGELQNLRILRLAQLNTISAQPYVGSALARLLNRGTNEDQIVKISNLMEMHPDIIHKLLQHCSDDKEQQQTDDFKLAWSLSSSSASSSSSSSPSPFLNSPSSLPQHKSESPSRRRQPQQPPLGPTLLTGQRSPSTPSIEPYSTPDANATELLPENETSQLSKESILLQPLENPDVKIQHDSPGIAVAGFAQKQCGPSCENNNGYESSEMGFKASKDNKDQDKLNPTLTRTITVRGREITLPKSILEGLVSIFGNS